MNKSMVRFLLSKLLLIEAALLLVPLIVAFIYQESFTIIFSILATMAILILLGSIGIIFKPKNYHIYTKEGLLIVALCWVLWSFFGALPFIFTGQIPNIIDAFFEVGSGFTTTGATILPDVSVLSHSLLFWRSFTHLIGGMGVLVFALAIMENSAKRFYGIQFHPEVTHTKQGRALLNRFVLDICGANPSWTMPNYIDEAVAKIRAQVGSDEVILGLSGGVDSSVAAALIHRAIGDQLTCVFVDHGLLRLDEGKNVMQMFAQNLGVKVVHVDASAQFMAKLAGVTDPEQKRKIIGAEFIEVFDAEEKKLTQAKWLAQGTIYPDVIESAGAKTKKAHAIKSHHNVGGLPENMNLKLLEPLRDLFKDEVRELGVALGLPREMVYRHPFPGPGLGVRVLGEVKREYADLLRQADAIFIEELRNTTDENGVSWYDLTSQAFAVFLPVKSVGVMGDGRTYDYVVALRAVVTSDFMTAHWAELPYALLGRVSNRIINEVRGINRVVYDVSGKPPATIEWE